MTHLNISRHQNVVDPHKHKHLPINIIGVGATGSRLWLNLIELGFEKINVFDFDKVEEHNLANQIFLHGHIGLPKVEALRQYYETKTGNEAPEGLTFNELKVEHQVQINEMSGVIFLLVDTMESRSQLAAFIADALPGRRITHVFETRLASSYGEAHYINPYNQHLRDRWVDSFIDDEEAEASPCGASISVGSTANMLAALSTWQLLNALEDPLSAAPLVKFNLRPFSLSAQD